MGELEKNLSSGYRKLQDAAQAAGLNPQSTSWLVKALDPFHDNPGVPCTGMPDSFEGTSIVREIDETYLLTADSLGITVGEGETWSLNFAILPTMSYARCGPILFQLQRGLAYGANAANWINSNQLAITLGQLTIAARNEASVGPADYPYPAPVVRAADWSPTSTNWKIGGYSPWEDYFPFPDGSNPTAVRCIGFAYEVVDMTNPYYQQGICTVYRMNTNFDQAPHQIFHHFEGAYVAGEVPGIIRDDYLFQLPANGSNTVMNLPGTRQWNAQKGIYQVAVMDPENLTDWAFYADRRGYIGIQGMYQGDEFQTTAALASSNCWKTPVAWYNGTSSVYDPGNDPFLPTATQTSGAFLEGLHPKATFQIRIRGVYESIPSYDQQDILLSRNQSPPYDPAALELYAQTIKAMPVGCTVEENPLGEWFDKVMTVLSAAAQGVASALPGTVYGTVGSAVSNAALWAKGFNQSFRT